MPDSLATRIHSDSVPYETLGPGVERKRFDSPHLQEHEVSITRLAPGATLSACAERDLEVFVLDGTWRLGDQDLGRGGYARIPAGSTLVDRSDPGAELFVRAGPLFEGQAEAWVRQTGPADWVPGQGNLRVLPLYPGSTSGTALVHWPAGERFVPHRHFGGEEILVLSGTFRDEHGSYPEGTWLLSPHLSTHHPFVEEETVILVKTGHLSVR